MSRDPEPWLAAARVLITLWSGLGMALGLGGVAALLAVMAL